ncbi:MAG: type II toxin-antitoxin system Phd/YefM family antitoxin [Pseudomonadota bacterium]
MHRMSARDAKNSFGRLIDLARAEPVAIEKYGRSVVVVIAVEEYERLSDKVNARLSASRSKESEGDKKLVSKQKRSSKPSKKAI